MEMNTAFKTAVDFVQHTSQALFLTGKAGTGKTTFLKYIKEQTGKQTCVVAPTGVAAINAGGVTIHSFFQLPFAPFVPVKKGWGADVLVNDVHALLGKIRVNKERRKIFNQLELLIIDEISMVRCDVLDQIDIVLKHFRQRYDEPFGGVQVLLIGDMYQLPPVANNEQWQILSAFYKSPYFFDSAVMTQNPPTYIELNKIYRQQNPLFIDVLNKVRNSEMDADSLSILHERYQPQFESNKKDSYITLTTHNAKADVINAAALDKLPGKLHEFKADIKGEFNESAYPADANLQLKVGAQVMFIKNDLEKVRRYFNGKIGVIEKLEADKIFVQCEGDAKPVEVRLEVWKNIRYSLNKEKQQVEEDELGSFSQMPLRLAWAITIHKSQGLTFEKAIIDAGDAFAPGQVYVALSRCTSLEGMVLKSKINSNSLHTDARIKAFADSKPREAALQTMLGDAKNEFHQKTILQIFDLQKLPVFARLALGVLTLNTKAFNAAAIEWNVDLISKTETVETVGKKFQTQLQQLFASHLLVHENEALQNRLKAAAIYFVKELSVLMDLMQACPAITDSRPSANDFDEQANSLLEELAKKKFAMGSCLHGFAFDQFQQAKNNFRMPDFNINAYAAAKGKYTKSNSTHPALHKELCDLRNAICETTGAPVYMVLNTASIDDMANYLPLNLADLGKINGFGKVKLEQFGQKFLKIINTFCAENNLKTNIDKLPATRQRKEEKPKVPKVDTKLESFKLFETGKTLPEIASERSLTVGTIEGHLFHFVNEGKIPVEKMLSFEKIEQIKQALKTVGEDGYAIIRDRMVEDVSYAAVKWVIANQAEEVKK